MVMQNNTVCGFLATAFLLLALLPFPSSALSASASGTCRDFYVTVEHDVQGCWDLKIDVPGKVLHPDGWKDSFFFVSNALCEPGTRASLWIRLNDMNNYTAVVKLRQNNTIIQEPLEIVQNCEFVGNENFWLVVILVIAVMLASILWYERKWVRF